MFGKTLAVCLISLVVVFSGVTAESIELEKILGTGAYTLNNVISSGLKFFNHARAILELNETIAYLSLQNIIGDIRVKLDHLKIPNLTNIEYSLYDLILHAEQIDNRYREYLDYSNESNGDETITLQEYADQVLNKKYGVLPLVLQLHKTVLGFGNNSLVNIVKTNIEELEPYCSSQQTRQQYFYNFFLSIIIHELKAYTIMQYAQQIKTVFLTLNFKNQSFDLNRSTEKRINITVSVFKDIIGNASAVMWRCDSKKHQENVTFVELRNVFQRIFYGERDFIGNSKASCQEMCPSNFSTPQCHKKGNCYLSQRTCSNVVNCGMLDYSTEYKVCLAKDQSYGSRYDFIDTHNKKHNFRRLCIKSNNYKTVKTKEEGKMLKSKCAMCDCICDEEHNSDRYVSLKPVISDIESNFIVTGIKFVKINYTLHLQIQQGKLLAGAFVSNRSAHWKNIESDDNEYFDVDDVHIHGLKSEARVKYITLGHNESISKRPSKFRLDWFNKRGLYLDDLELESNHVVTGVRFIVDERGDSDLYLKLDIHATPFNITTGELFTADAYWFSTFAPEYQRNLLNIDGTKPPNFFTNEQPLDTTPHQYTHFVPTNILTGNAGQSIVPFIDIQPVFSNPAAALSGLSLGIKRSNNSGGYLTLKLKTYNVLIGSVGNIY